jgi:hypothetical protein
MVLKVFIFLFFLGCFEAHNGNVGLMLMNSTSWVLVASFGIDIRARGFPSFNRTNWKLEKKALS